MFYRSILVWASSWPHPHSHILAAGWTSFRTKYERKVWWMIRQTNWLWSVTPVKDSLGKRPNAQCESECGDFSLQIFTINVQILHTLLGIYILLPQRVIKHKWVQVHQRKNYKTTSKFISYSTMQLPWKIFSKMGKF